MKHTASRLLPYAVNGVIDIRNVRDPALKRLVKSPNVTPHVRSALKQIDRHYELLIPYAVDSEELQLKRYIQLKAANKSGERLTVNLSDLRTNFYKYYLKLYQYGSAETVLKKWGFHVLYGDTMREETVIEELHKVAVSGVIEKFPPDGRLYRAVRYQAMKYDKTMEEYLGEYGLTYKGGVTNAGSNKNRVRRHVLPEVSPEETEC